MKMRAAVAGRASFSNVPVTESFLPLRVASALPEPTIAAAFDVIAGPSGSQRWGGDKRTLYFVPLLWPADIAKAARPIPNNTVTTFRFNAMSHLLVKIFGS